MCRGVHGGAQRCAEVHGDARRCTEVCGGEHGGVHGGVCGGVHGDVWRCACVHVRMTYIHLEASNSYSHEKKLY